MDPRYRATVLLAAYGGLRAGELFGLRAKRVDPLRRTVSHRRDGGRRRRPSPLRPTQDPGRPPHGPSPPCRCRPAGRTPGRTTPAARGPRLHRARGRARALNVWRRRFWVPATRAAGLGHLRPHDLRHTAVALWIAAGAHPKEVAVRAGHTSVSFTLDRYGHLFPGSEEVSNDSLDALVQRRSARPRSDDGAAIVREKPDSFAHVARTPDDNRRSDRRPQRREQDLLGGRCGTRTHDLSRVKAAL